MLPAVTASLPTYWLYVMTLYSTAFIYYFFKAREGFTAMQPGATILKISGTGKDAQNLLTCSLRCPLPHKSEFIKSDGSIGQTLNYKCDELKWQNYLVGGKRSGFPLMLRDSCQDVSCCRLFCFYHMCCVFSRCTKSQDCCWSPEPFWAYAAACVQLKIKYLLFKTAGSIFSGGTRTDCKY